jgi:hypothetical protein
MRALTAYREPLAVSQPAIAPEVHQPLYVHRDLPPEIALDRVVAINQFTNPQYLVIGQFLYPPLYRDPHPAADLERFAPPDAMNVSQPDRYQLLVRYIDASNPRHLRFSSKNGNGGKSNFSQGQAL